MKRRPSSKLTVIKALRAPAPLLNDLREMIRAAREHVARAVNTGLTLLYWQMGARIRREVLREKRAGYGEEIIQTLSGQLAAEFGPGFSRSNLFAMVRFAELFPDPKIVQTLSAQIGLVTLRVDPARG